MQDAQEKPLRKCQNGTFVMVGQNNENYYSGENFLPNKKVPEWHFCDGGAKRWRDEYKAYKKSPSAVCWSQMRKGFIARQRSSRPLYEFYSHSMVAEGLGDIS